MTKSLTYVEIDIPSFGDSPDVLETFRFTTDTSYLPNNIAAIPSIKNIKVTSPIISLGRDLGQRGMVEVTLKDHRHIFNGEDYNSGTFWGKFRARYGLTLRGYDFRLINGKVGDSLAAMETRHYIIESTDGPSTKGEFKIIAKDVLKFLDGDRAQAPVLNSGALQSAITSTSTVITLSPTGIGDKEYTSSTDETLHYVNIGGSEVAIARRYYGEPSNDSFVKILLKMNQSAGTTFTDSNAGGSAHTWTAAGNAQTVAVSDNPYGAFAGSFDGSGDWVTTPDHADFTLGTSNFAIDFWFKRSAVGAQKNLFGQTDSLASPTLTSIICFFDASNILNAQVRVGGVTLTFQHQTAISDTTTWHHALINRDGSTFRVFLDGVEPSSTGSNAGSIVDSSEDWAIGQIGEVTTSPWQGNISQFRLSVGTSRHTSTFTPRNDYTISAGDSGDTLFLMARAQFNTSAVAHEAGIRIQQCILYNNEDVADIIHDLMTSYGGVDSSFIDLTAWQNETATYLNTVYITLLTEPTAVKDLISELIEQAGLVIWHDDINQQIRLQVIRAISTTAFTYNADNTLADTLEVKEQPEKRLSQVYFYFARLNPLVNLDQIDNYRSSVRVVDVNAESEYGGAAIRRIFSRWITTGGRTTAETAAENIISRYRDPPRRINFEVLKYSVDRPSLGGGYQVGGWPFQDTDGTAVEVPVQLTRVQPAPDRYEVEGEEMLFAASAPFSPDDRQIIIDADQNNVNLKTMHDNLYSAASAGDTVTCTILAGVVVGSSTVATPAFNVGTWSPTPTINLVVEGRIQGKGGDGGTGGFALFASSGSGSSGQAGGTALYTRHNVALSGSGEIWGGGGGQGGTGGYHTGGAGYGGAGGGGGAGTTPGNGGNGGFGSTASGANGTAGSSEAGGGGGGAPGQAGTNGSNTLTALGGSGGTAGAAEDGTSFTSGGGSIDFRGGQIN